MSSRLKINEKLIITSNCAINLEIDSLYFETFPEIAEFCALLVTHFENKNPITLSCPNNSNFQYQQLLYETIKIPRTSFQRSRKSDLSINLQTDKPDYKKIKRSLVANFIHYLDSRLNFLVINKCRMESIPLWINHDCFYVCPTKKSRLLNHYFNSFIELLLKDDVIKHFLDVNNIKASDSLEKLLKISSVNREVILKELGNGDLKMSKFILSS